LTLDVENSETGASRLHLGNASVETKIIWLLDSARSCRYVAGTMFHKGALARLVEPFESTRPYSRFLASSEEPSLSRMKAKKQSGHSQVALKLAQRFKRKAAHGEIWHGDAVHFLQSLPDKSAEIVFLDPPFNLGKQYDALNPNGDRRPESEYETWLQLVLMESARILKDGGALYVYHLPIWAIRIGAFLDRTLSFRHWIAVSMKNGFVRGTRLYPAHYALLLFTKGRPSHFKRPKLKPQECRHCGKYVKDYGGYREIIDRRGINLSDFWEDLSPVRHSNRKHRTANELPARLLERVVAISGTKGGLFVDPFGGSGVGLVAAAKGRMVFKGCDIVRANCAVMSKRLTLYCDAL
jgi:site-specific DNA-methyltransferase (adenine-specific)